MNFRRAPCHAACDPQCACGCSRGCARGERSTSYPASCAQWAALLDNREKHKDAQQSEPKPQNKTCNKTRRRTIENRRLEQINRRLTESSSQHQRHSKKTRSHNKQNTNKQMFQTPAPQKFNVGMRVKESVLHNLRASSDLTLPPSYATQH